MGLDLYVSLHGTSNDRIDQRRRRVRSASPTISFARACCYLFSSVCKAQELFVGKAEVHFSGQMSCAQLAIERQGFGVGAINRPVKAAAVLGYGVPRRPAH